MAQINQLYADMKSQINNLFSQNSEITVIEFWDVIYASKYLHLIIKSIGFKYNLQTEEILHELYILGLSTNLFSTILKRRVYNNKFLIYELLRIARKLVRINHNHVNIDDENIQNEMSSSPDLGLDDEIIRSAEVQEINNKVAILQTQQIMNLSSRIAHLSSLSGYWLKLELNIPDEKFILMRKKLTNKDIMRPFVKTTNILCSIVNYSIRQMR